MRTGLCLETFNADFNTDVCDSYNNAELMITLRIGFRQINPAGGTAVETCHDYGDPTATPRKIIRWTPGQ